MVQSVRGKGQEIPLMVLKLCPSESEGLVNHHRSAPLWAMAPLYFLPPPILNEMIPVRLPLRPLLLDSLASVSVTVSRAGPTAQSCDFLPRL